MNAVVESPTAKIRADSAGCFLRIGTGALFVTVGAMVACGAVVVRGSGGGYMVLAVLLRRGSMGICESFMINRRPRLRRVLLCRRLHRRDLFHRHPRGTQALLLVRVKPFLALAQEQ